MGIETTLTYGRMTEGQTDFFSGNIIVDSLNVLCEDDKKQVYPNGFCSESTNAHHWSQGILLFLFISESYESISFTESVIIKDNYGWESRKNFYQHWSLCWHFQNLSVNHYSISLKVILLFKVYLGLLRCFNWIHRM